MTRVKIYLIILEIYREHSNVYYPTVSYSVLSTSGLKLYLYWETSLKNRTTKIQNRTSRGKRKLTSRSPWNGFPVTRFNVQLRTEDYSFFFFISCWCTLISWHECTYCDKRGGSLITCFAFILTSRMTILAVLHRCTFSPILQPTLNFFKNNHSFIKYPVLKIHLVSKYTWGNNLP